jgi:acetylornithine deacetylase/succinyl-diaminopimelate desuccinylase-like protein
MNAYARVSGLITLALAAAAGAQSGPHPDSAHRAIFRELVEFNSSPDGGQVSAASRAVARRLLAAGFPAADVQVVGPNARCLNVVATLRGRDRSAKPVLTMAHLDVVNAKRADWVYDPFKLREGEGFFYGRGAIDNKAGASVLVANMVQWKRERFVPARDVVMVLTCDEETSAEQGIRWLLANVPRLTTADYALNTDAGGVAPTASGRPAFSLQAAEKTYVTFELTASNPGGHSSVPRSDNAIYALSAALGRLSAHRFPIEYNEVTRTSYARSADLETGQLAEDLRAAGRGETGGAAIERLLGTPYLGAGLHTTCVATMLRGGHAENALPQSATATVNCRMMPGTDHEQLRQTLVGIVADTTIKVAITYQPTPSGASPLRPELMRVIEATAAEVWPRSVVVPDMSNGATDGLYLRNVGVPVYGVAGILMNPEDDRSHGLDEKVPVKSLYESRRFWDRLVKALLTTSPGPVS